jgi:uncharacterized membrane protein
MGEKPVESVVIWSRYLAFATAFSIADRVSSELHQPILSLMEALGGDSPLWSPDVHELWLWDETEADAGGSASDSRSQATPDGSETL